MSMTVMVAIVGGTSLAAYVAIRPGDGGDD